MMKLRIRINRQTCRVEIPGDNPSLTELKSHIKDTVLSSHGLSEDTEFNLSLNGSELLSDTGQTLSSCSIVSGDLICVVLPESVSSAIATTSSAIATTSTAIATTSSAAASTSTSTTFTHRMSSPTESQRQQVAAMTPSQANSSSVALTEPAETPDPEAPGPCWEPMLCSMAEAGQAPLSLEILYHSAKVTSPTDAIMVAGHLLMIETGFIPQACELKPGEMPGGWRSAGGVYKLQYTHPLCENSVATVIGVSMGPTFVTNAILKVNETVDTTPKLCLNPSSYVTDEWPGESAAAAFRDLRKLSRVFKDQLAYPLIATARDAMALPVVFGLAALPPELLLRVICLLDVHSVVRLSSVSRHFNMFTADSMVWRHLYRRDFRDSGPRNSRETDWKELYKTSYTLIRERRHAARPFLFPYGQEPFVPFPIPAPFHPPLPGIIGGDYDHTPSFLPRGPHPRRFDPINFDPLHMRQPQGNSGRPRPMGGRGADIRRGFI